MLHNLTITNVRNISYLDTKLSKLNIFIGDNGAGKTSVLESINTLFYFKTFRGSNIDSLVSIDKPYFLLEGISLENKDLLKVYKPKQEDLQIKINGTDTGKIKAKKEISRNNAVDVFSPYLEGMVSGGAETRRNFINNIMFHVEHKFYDEWKKYKYTLDSRNALLKRRLYNDDEFWLHRLAEHGTNIHNMRCKYIELFIPFLDKWLDMVDLPKVELILKSGWDDKKSYLEICYQNMMIDRRNGFTKAGPHKADIEINYNGHLAKYFCSRGQEKMLNLILILAKLDFINSYKKNTILLLDDISSELDKNNIDILLNKLLPASNLQVFISSIEYNKDLFKNNKEDITSVFLQSGKAQ
jgi:DNA replication and repair protein RecF